jgi:two-component system phosphate regulon sensor histidine kinase PhoR
MAHRNSVNLHLAVENNEIPSILIDSLKFHEVIENLISNALEYTPRHGTVTVNIVKVGKTISFSIKDTGIGISAADQKNLFTKFFRTEKATGQNPQGSGLGLYLVKSYVEDWGGTVSVQSTEGKGSTFTISLPTKLK